MKHFTQTVAKAILLFYSFLFVCPSLALNTNDTRIVNVTTAGSLSTLIPQDEREYIVNLTVSGELNGTDIIVLQDLACNKMKVLDMSEASIVEGGDTYYTWTAGSYTSSYSTKDDVVGAYMFHKTTSLEKVILPSTAKTIEGGAFGYGSLKSMTIGQCVTSITAGLCAGTTLDEIILNGNTAFTLQDGILYNKAKTTVYKAIRTIEGDISLPSSVTTIENSSFSGCDLRSIVIPTRVKKIETATFDNCPYLEQVTFPNGLTELGYDSFGNCQQLKNVDLSNTKVTKIEMSFYNCQNIEEMSLPTTLKEITGSSVTSRKLNKITCAASTPPTLEVGRYMSFQYSSICNTCNVFVPKGRVNTYKEATGWKNFYNIYEIGQEPEIEKPAAVATLEDLQTRLDNIAAKGLPWWRAETIELADEGVLVDKVLYVRNGCHAILTGGPLRISPIASWHYCVSISDNSSLSLRQMTVDLMNNDFHINSGIFYNRGTLRVGEGANNWDVNFVNVPTEKGNYGECLFYLERGSTLFYNTPGKLYSGEVSVIKADEMANVYIWKGEIESRLVPTIDGSGRVELAATVCGGGKGISIINAREYYTLEGWGTIIDREGGATYINADTIIIGNYGNGTFGGNGKNIVIGSQASINGYTLVPVLCLKKDAGIKLTGTLQVEWTLDGDWNAFTLGSTIVENVPSRSDFDKMTFINMPVGREAWYDENEHKVLLRQKGEDGIEDVKSQMQDCEQSVYDAQGRRMEKNSHGRGLHLQRMNDGKVRKVMLH